MYTHGSGQRLNHFKRRALSAAFQLAQVSLAAMPREVFLVEMTRLPHLSQRLTKCLFQLHFFHSHKRNDEAVLNVRHPLTIVNIFGVFSMFKTYRHAELSPAAVFGGGVASYWQFVELEVHHPWFYIELVRDYGDDIVGSMLMVPTVPILQQMLSELDERSWFGQAHLMSPGHLRGGDNWKMEPLIEVGVAQDNKGEVEGYLFKVAGGVSYSTHHSRDHSNLKVTEIIFSADRDLRAHGG